MTTKNKAKEPFALCQACAGWYIGECQDVWEKQPVIICDRFKFYASKSFKDETIFRSHFPAPGK